MISVAETKSWLGRLLDIGLIHSSGRIRATRYFLNPELLRNTALSLTTTLTLNPY